MRETVEYLKQEVREMVDVARYQWRPFAVSLFIVAMMYAGIATVPPSWAAYAACVPACVLICIIALVRLNAIGPEDMGFVWHARRMGLILLGVAAATLLATPLMDDPLFPSWRGVLLINGGALTLLTTPEQKPFWKYWSGQWRLDTESPRPPISRFLHWYHNRKMRWIWRKK